MTDDQVLPHGDYLPAAITGNTVISAGMTPRVDGVLAASGSVGTDQISVEQAASLAGLSVRRAIDACRQSLPQDARLVRPVTMTVYIRSGPDFARHSDVANGASAVLAECFEGQTAARAAVGVPSLPGGSPVEVVLTAEWATG